MTDDDKVLIRQEILSYLDAGSYAYTLHEHEALHTCADAARIRVDTVGAACKNLFVRNKRGDQHYLIVAQASRAINLKALRKDIGASALSFASEERLARCLKTSPGSVSPLGLIYAPSEGLEVLVDEGLWAHGHVNFHPNCNRMTVEMAVAEFRRFLEAVAPLHQPF